MGVIHIILKVGHPKIISTKISEQKILMWFLSDNIPKWNILAEKISQKNPEYMLNYSLTCSCSLNLSSFWLILKQQWTIKISSPFFLFLAWQSGSPDTILEGGHPRTTNEISIFSNSSNFEWRVGLLDTLLKGDHSRTIPAKFALIWFSSFREDLNVIVYQNMPNFYNRY